MPLRSLSLLVLCPEHQLPSCRERRALNPMRTRKKRSIAPWRYTTLPRLTISCCLFQGDQLMDQWLLREPVVEDINTWCIVTSTSSSQQSHLVLTYEYPSTSGNTVWADPVYWDTKHHVFQDRPKQREEHYQQHTQKNITSEQRSCVRVQNVLRWLSP